MFTLLSFRKYAILIPIHAVKTQVIFSFQVDGLVQEKLNSVTNALELRLSCTNLSMYRLFYTYFTMAYPNKDNIFVVDRCCRIGLMGQMVAIATHSI